MLALHSINHGGVESMSGAYRHGDRRLARILRVIVTVVLTMTVGVSAAPMSTANRTSGVAPLAVFFDAVASGSGVVQPSDGDYARLHYEWGFSDPASGTWATGRRNPDGSYPSKNQAIGYVAAHVFERPGVYIVSLQVIDAGGQTHEYQQPITVTDPATEPGWTTYYVSSSTGNDSNSGLSLVVPFKTFAKAKSMLAPRVRMLFKRGENWTYGGQTWLNAGPGIIGAYANADGSDNPALAKPHITQTHNGYAFHIGHDWRLRDLELEGSGAGPSTGDGIAAQTTRNHWLALRLEIHEFERAFGMVHVGDPHDGHAIAGCEVYDVNQRAGWVGGNRFAILGSTFRKETLNTSQIRTWHGFKTVYSHNVFGAGQSGVFKFRNQARQLPGNPDGQYIVISDNDFLNDHVTGAWPVEIAPQNIDNDGRIRDVVVERNIFRATGLTQRGLTVAARNVTVRNNVFIGTGGHQYYSGVVFFHRGIEPALTGNRVYNNTIYRGDSASGFTAVSLPGSNSEARNNLASAPSVGSANMIGSSPAQSHNLLTNNPGFSNPGNGDFRLTSSSSARDAGTATSYVREDVVGTARPQGTTHDIGAFEYTLPSP